MASDRGYCRRPAVASWFPYIDFPPRAAGQRETEWSRETFPLYMHAVVCACTMLVRARGCARAPACVGVRDRARRHGTTREREADWYPVGIFLYPFNFLLLRFQSNVLIF
ncbi:hypothetical protein PUN28_007069 [Cardiocondyla obscurior]|uniref:Uncharacterized protein n=1 Tax=Cardiocondyla obscurior TaxID=286306 RepID=A0AAW2G657_9HYME